METSQNQARDQKEEDVKNSRNKKRKGLGKTSKEERHREEERRRYDNVLT